MTSNDAAMSKEPKDGEPRKRPVRHRRLKEVAMVAALGPAVGGLAGAINPVHWIDDKAWAQTQAEAIGDGVMLGALATVPAGAMVLADRRLRRLEAKDDNRKGISHAAGPPGRPITISVELTPEAAEALWYGPVPDELRQIVARPGVDLVPAFPGASEPSSKCHFIVTTPDRASAEQLIREFQNSAAIASAYLTQPPQPPAEPDKRTSHVERVCRDSKNTWAPGAGAAEPTATHVEEVTARAKNRGPLTAWETRLNDGMNAISCSKGEQYVR